MSEQLMILPAHEPSQTRLVRIPNDLEAHEAYRQVTGLIAGVEESQPGYDWDDIAAVLEEHGYEPVDFILGPMFD